MMPLRCPSALELIGAWERGMHQPPVERALTLLAAASKEPREQLATLSIGLRDAGLLELHDRLFGPTLDAYAECPACGERLEYSVTQRDLSIYSTDQGRADDLEATQGDLFLRLRLPNSEDLRAASWKTDLAAARRTLMERCIVEARRGDVPISAETLPQESLELAASRLAEADPGADVQIDLTCPSCGHGWQVALDIECFLWAKVNSLAKRLLTEVHVLAGAYGWTETEVLELSSARRQFYLEMVS